VKRNGVSGVLLQLVEEVIQRWDSLLETLTFPTFCYDLSWLAVGLKWISRQDLPMIKHILWE
jgi:hypothetical protein